MSEEIVSLLVIASQVGAAFALILFVVVFLIVRASIKKKAQAKELVGRIKDGEDNRRELLINKVKEVTSLEDGKATEVIDVILGTEKQLYNQFVRAYMGYDKDAMGKIDTQVKKLEDSFVSLVQASAEAAPQSGDNEGETLEQKKQITRLRDEKMLLKEKNSQLQADFDAAMESMESMTLEYAQMYEGGSKEGEQRMKNEMYQLKQKLSGSNQQDGSDDEDSGDGAPEEDANKS